MDSGVIGLNTANVHVHAVVAYPLQAVNVIIQGKTTAIDNEKM